MTSHPHSSEGAFVQRVSFRWRQTSSLVFHVPLLGQLDDGGRGATLGHRRDRRRRRDCRVEVVVEDVRRSNVSDDVGSTLLFGILTDKIKFLKRMKLTLTFC
jgi:hypothetical protein